jgi:3-oxoacyl-[acyl-carrier-protein] synthase II
MAEQRRVVVTGLGLLCGVGNTAPEVWEGLLAGKSGMAEIKAYDLEGHSVRFAAEVKDFDPHVFVDKKEARKMGRFIHFAMAAAHEAMEHSGLKITPENGEILRGPPAIIALCSRSMMSNPPMPEPMWTPTISPFSGVT